ncbi:hypothetical protein [Colwellia sp. Arc7-D]|uniref:hypothetical protein n=1 Tax=Colwellia sp. Arc7-D TaxID=2161872 RepID=UPI000D397A37|nr:hypothetical protein [Colwellia sp. Arc7-D]AWB58202.1 hypothetical protein DBO93_11905 [Colwellia sp. Arc7-D]
MWVTQTYLGTVEPEAKVFVYYLFEDYNTDQSDFTNAVQIELEKIGAVHESNVSLLMPNPRYAARIEAEVRSIEKLWWSLSGKLPGLLVSTKPLSEFKESIGNYYFASFESTSPYKAAETLQEVRKLANEQLAWEHNNKPVEAQKSFFKKLYDAIEAKPGVAGFNIDLKKLKG